MLKLIRIAGLSSLLLVFASQAVQAATTWDFRTGGSAGTNTGTHYGNERTFTENGETVTVNAWADTGPTPPANALEEAYLGRFSTGLGICNMGEGSINHCVGSGTLHQLDNVSQEDLALFEMDGQYFFDEIVIDPFGQWDRDVTFWIGTITPGLDLTGVGIADLATVGFTYTASDYNGVGSAPLTIDLGGVQGNALLFGALFPPNHNADRFKIQSLTATLVPIPASVWLFGSSLAVIGWLRRKRA